MTVPPADLFPAELHLRKVCGVVWCYTGPQEAAAELFAPVQALGTPLLHGVAPMPYPALQSLFDGLYVPGLQWYWRADFVRKLPDAAIEQHVAFAEKLPTLHSTMHLYPIDGARAVLQRLQGTRCVSHAASPVWSSGALVRLCRRRRLCSSASAASRRR